MNRRLIAKAMRAAAKEHSVLEDITDAELLENIIDNNDGDTALFKILSESLGLEEWSCPLEYWCEVDRQLWELGFNGHTEASGGAQKVWPE